MKLWVDPPSGWQYGFPKIWDDQEEPDMTKWLSDNGYPESEKCPYVRMWNVEEKENTE